jgi:hypothetical protein
MKEIKMEPVEGKGGGFVPVCCEKGKMATAGDNPISDHVGIILEALDDYRRWFSENDDSDKETIKLIDDAIEFVKFV